MRVYHDTQSYIALVAPLHQHRYDYSETVFIQMNKPVTVICPEHGKFFPVAGNHKKTGCPGCFEARRGDGRRMNVTEFVERLTAFNPKLSLVDVSTFRTASDPVRVRCRDHGEFSGVPTRLLTYKLACKCCYAEHTAKQNRNKSGSLIAQAIVNLPGHIRVLTQDPGWATDTRLHCDYHGEFTTQLDRVASQSYVCNECAKEHWQGKARVSYIEYAAFIARNFPNPPHKITLLETSYLANIGTKTVHLRCEEHGDFYRERSTINNGRLGTPCPYCKINGVSTSENRLIEFVRSLVPETEQGNRSVIAPKELDCWVPSKALAIEFCGLYWHSDLKLDKGYHLDKLNACGAAGVSLLQVFEDEWLNNPNICKSIISHRLGFTSQKFYARKLTLVECEFSAVKDFLNDNHIQGFVPAQKYYALMDGEDIRAVATFSYNRLKKDGNWELVRYCSALDTVVVGGLARLVKHFMKTNRVTKLVSYCCLRWFSGAGYEKAGFKLIGRTEPSYFYTNKQMRVSRHSAKKHKLGSKIPQFDPALTETENMVNAGFSKIYDCGNLVYEFCS